MSCITLIEPACKAAGGVIKPVTGSAAGGVLGGIAQAILFQWPLGPAAADFNGRQGCCLAAWASG